MHARILDIVLGKHINMRGILISNYGDTPAIKEVEKPMIKSNSALIQVKSSTVNHLDVLKASGVARSIFPINLPWIPGHEFSGRIIEVDLNTSSLKPGDSVFGNVLEGAYGEYLVADINKIAKMPTNLSFEQAASVPVAAQTAWQGLFTEGRLLKGQSILIHGGAGAVGAYAVQLAHNIGAKVIATASEEDHDFVTSLGAYQVINYRASRFEDVIDEPVDVVFDLVGSDTQQRSFKVLKKGGRLIASNQPVSPVDALKHGVIGYMMDVAPSSQMLEEIAKLLETKKLATDVAKIYDLQDVSQAWQDITSNLSRGKEDKNKSKNKHGKLVVHVS